MRYLGLLTENNRWRARKMYDLFRLKPLDFLKASAKEANVSCVSALLKLVKAQMRLPRKEKKAMKRWSKMWKEISRPEELIASVPESLPYRNETDIRVLFEGLGIPVKDMAQLTSCITVQI